METDRGNGLSPPCLKNWVRATWDKKQALFVVLYSTPHAEKREGFYKRARNLPKSYCALHLQHEVGPVSLKIELQGPEQPGYKHRRNHSGYKAVNLQKSSPRKKSVPLFTKKVV